MLKYREEQMNRISNHHNDHYRARLQIRNVEGNTNWLDITDKELAMIKVILTHDEEE